MNDKPTLGEPVAKSPEIKPSLTVPYFLLVLLCTAIVAGATQAVNRAVESWSVEKKVLFLTTTSSQNLATIRGGLTSTLEFRLALSSTDKRTIKSLFSYQVAVHNQSTEAAESFVLHMYPPEQVTLIDPPRIATDSKMLANSVLKSKRALEREIVFDFDLLGPGQRVTLVYFGYSEEAIDDGKFIDVETQKKAWVVRKAIPGYSSWYDPETGQITVSHAGYNDFEPYEPVTSSVLSKRIAAYDGGDVPSLLLIFVTVTCVCGLLTWILARVLRDPAKSFHVWKSLVVRILSHEPSR